MRRGWLCLGCRASIGVVTNDRLGRYHLRAFADQVVAVKTVQPGALYEVTCRCGSRREFAGHAVHIEQRNAAA